MDKIEAHTRITGLKPFIYPEARILILGSMPSIQSLADNFYYANPQNRFFKIIAQLVTRELATIEHKKQALYDLKIALYDCIKSCVRVGSLDSAIEQIEPANIQALITQYPRISTIITNGALSKRIFLKYNHLDKIKTIYLPSTSPANAKYSLAALYTLYREAILSKEVS